MKVLVVGGGSGGHITPAIAAVREILALKPRTRVEFWTDRKYYDNVVKITTEIGVAWGEGTASKGGLAGARRKGSGTLGKSQYIQVKKVAAGKFHRYNWKLADYFENFSITLKDVIWGNICGFFGFSLGILQSLFRLIRKSKRPDVIFLKGGFVGLPVGVVAKWLKIPYVVHESDAVPGLANRILMKKAVVVAQGVPFKMPLKSDTSEKAEAIRAARKNWRFTGIPVAPEFRPVPIARQKQLKKAFGFDPSKPLVVVTGGSQGAAHINEVIREILPEMLKFASVGLVAGREKYEEMVDLKKYEDWEKAKLQSDFRLWSFCSTMNELMGAADVVVSRAGATTIAELAGLAKAVVLVPFEKLPGGHQVKNADLLAEQGAAAVVYDERMVREPELLLELTRKLVRSPRVREDLARSLHTMANPGAAAELAKLILKVGAASERVRG